jgi:hypothetical protein
LGGGDRLSGTPNIGVFMGTTPGADGYSYHWCAWEVAVHKQFIT